MIRSWLCRMLVIAVLGVPLALIKAEDAPPPAEPKVVFAGSVSIASFDAVKDAVNSLLLPMPPNLDPDNIEQQFGFIGKDGLDRTKPAAVYFLVGGKPMPPGKAAVIVLPCKHPENFLNQIKAKGIPQAVAGKEIYQIKDSCFRFTPSYIILGGTLDAIQKIDDATLAASFNAGDALVRLEVDQKTIRDAFPEFLDAFYQNVRNRNQEPVTKPRQAGRDFAEEYMKKIETLKLEASKQAGLSLKLWVTPGYAAIPASLSAPAIPANCPGRLDLLVPAAGTGDWSLKFFEFARENGAFEKSKDAHLAPFVKDFIYLLAGGDGISATATAKDGEPVLYFVKQYTVDYNFAAEAKKAAEKGASLVKDQVDAEGKPEVEPIKVDTYTTDKGESVTRVAIIEKAGTKGYFDALQRGKTVFMTFCKKDGKHVGDLCDLPPSATPMAAGLAAQLDVSALLDLIAALPVEKLQDGKVPMSPAELKELATVFKGKPLVLSYESKVPHHLVALNIPPNVIAGVLRVIIMSQMQEPAKAPAPVPGDK